MKTKPCEGGVVLYGGDCGDNFDQPLGDWTGGAQDAGAQDASVDPASDALDTLDAATGATDAPDAATNPLPDATVSGDALDPCDELTCHHGICARHDGLAQCVCERGYSGPACDTCAPQFSPATDEDRCEPDCGDCGPHGFCDATAELPECQCARGYVDDGDGCAWHGGGENGGGLVDEELDDGGAWVTRHVAIEHGMATFSSTTLDGECELGVLAQRFDMPPADDAEPFVLELELATTCTAGSAAACPALQVEVGSRVTRAEVPGGSSGLTRRVVPVCLGNNAYGDDVPLRIRPSLARWTPGATPSAFSCKEDAWPALEALRVRPARQSECPAELAFGSGAGGALALARDASVTARIVFPSDDELPSSALMVTRSVPPSGPSGSLVVAIDGLPWAFALSNATAWAFCLPDWARGQGHELRLLATNADVRLSSVAIGSDPKCGEGRFDSGFERGDDGVWPGKDGSWSIVQGAGYPVIDGDASREGARGLHLISIASAIQGLVRIPEAEGGAGPAFALYSRVNDDAVSGQLAPVAPFGTRASTLSATSWSLDVMCLDRAWQGQLAAARVTVGLSGGSAGIDLDQLGPTLSESCE